MFIIQCHKREAATECILRGYDKVCMPQQSNKIHTGSAAQNVKSYRISSKKFSILMLSFWPIKFALIEMEHVIHFEQGLH